MFSVAVLIVFVLAPPCNRILALDLSNNVCQRIEDYDTRWTNHRCWYNPDVWSTTDAIARRHGFSTETHKVTTQDGYILTIFRILPSIPNAGWQPVFIQHGAIADSSSWMVIGNRSLPFFLSRLGYDVWLGNNRGTRYSNEHVTYETNSAEYWQFGLDEIALYDLSAELNLVARSTGRPGDIIYIGHSMGGEMGTLYGIARKKEALNLLRACVYIGPIGYFDHSYSFWFLFRTIFPTLKMVLDLLQIYGLFQDEYFSYLVSRNFCFLSATNLRICLLVSSTIFGDSMEQLKPEDMPMWFSVWPKGISTRTLDHFAQIGLTGKVRKYDFGTIENLIRYGQTEPPDYDLSEFVLPVHAFYGLEDPASTLPDLEHLMLIIGSVDKNLHRIPEYLGTHQFTHADFLFAKDIEGYFYLPLTRLMYRYHSV